MVTTLLCATITSCLDYFQSLLPSLFVLPSVTTPIQGFETIFVPWNHLAV